MAYYGQGLSAALHLGAKAVSNTSLFLYPNTQKTRAFDAIENSRSSESGMVNGQQRFWCASLADVWGNMRAGSV